MLVVGDAGVGTALHIVQLTLLYSTTIDRQELFIAYACIGVSSLSITPTPDVLFQIPACVRNRQDNTDQLIYASGFGN